MTPDAHHQSVSPLDVLPLDERLYRLDRAFFKQQTGIEDNNELKTHLLFIQAKAYEVSLFFSLLGPVLIQSQRFIHIGVYVTFRGQGMTILI